MTKKISIDLHLHPFISDSTIEDVVGAMDTTGLDVVALEALDQSIHPSVEKMVREKYSDSFFDPSGIRLPNGKYILNAREYGTKENLHLITVGYSVDDATPQTEIRRVIDAGLGHGAFVLLDHPFVDNGRTKTAGHISAELEREVEQICKEYSGQIALEWNGYCVPWIRWVIKNALNVFGAGIRYHDVNQKAEELSAKLQKEGYNVPVVPDTDLHVRSKRHLKYMGTARIITDIDGETPREVVDSMKKNVFDRRYECVKMPVDFMHLLEAFCLPAVLPYFKKPRA
jgi:hypothetical protein